MSSQLNICIYKYPAFAQQVNVNYYILHANKFFSIFFSHVCSVIVYLKTVTVFNEDKISTSNHKSIAIILFQKPCRFQSYLWKHSAVPLLNPRCIGDDISQTRNSFSDRSTEIQVKLNSTKYQVKICQRPMLPININYRI